MIFFIKKLKKKKKGGQKKHDEVKKKWIHGVSFVDCRSFQTNKRVIRFYRELVSRNRNLNEVEIYYFCQFTILTQFLSFR